MNKFYIRLALFSTMILIADLAWQHFGRTSWRIPHVVEMLIFFFASTGIFHYLSVRSSKDRPQVFIRFYMGATAVRIIVYLSIILGYKLYDNIGIKPFAIGFFIHYILFAIFEIPQLLRAVRGT